METSRPSALIGFVVLVVVGVASRARAGIADTPLPQFADGKPSVMVLAVPGVVKRNRLQTDVLCSSVASDTVDIGVEIFDPSGALLNDVHAGVGAVLNVSPGQTVTIGTGGTAAFLESVTIPLSGVAQGSLRVVASAAAVRCGVLVVDNAVTPPVTVGELGAGVRPAPGPGLPTVSLPQFASGRTATHAAVIPGVVKRGPLETEIFCTSLAAQPLDLGVQVFGTDGVVANNVGAGNGALLNVAPGATVTFGTTGTVAFLETAVIMLPGVAQGMARVVSTSGEVTCEAFVIDSTLTPPTAMSRLVGAIGVASSETPTASPTQSSSPTASATASRTPTRSPTVTRTRRPTITPHSPTPIVGCSGDCDRNGRVTVVELVRSVDIALGKRSLDDCPELDFDTDGSVTINELVRAVNAALDGCVEGASTR